MSNDWFYAKSGQKNGPVSLDDLKRLIQQGQLAPADLVWRSGMEKWSPMGTVPGLLVVEKQAPIVPPSALPPVAPPVPVPEPLADQDDNQLLGLVSPFLSSQKREGIRAFLKTWSSLSRTKKAGVIAVGLFVAALIAWRSIFASSDSMGNGILGLLLSSGLLGAVVTSAFSVLANFMTYNDETISTPDIPLPQVFLGLSSPQLVSLCVSLYLPIMLASLVSSFLLGPELYKYLAGPLLVVLSVTIVHFSLSKQSYDRLLGSDSLTSKLRGLESYERTAIFVAFLTICGYGLSFLLDRWWLVLYVLIVTLPALHLFFLSRRGVSPVQFIWPLRIGIVILCLAVCLGVWVLPRPSSTSQLVGTWVSADKGKAKLIVTQGGSATLYSSGGNVNHHATFTLRGNNLTLQDAHRIWTFTLDAVSDQEIALVAKDSDSHYSGFEGRWRRQGASDTENATPSDSTPETPKPIRKK